MNTECIVGYVIKDDDDDDCCFEGKKCWKIRNLKIMIIKREGERCFLLVDFKTVH